MRKKPRSKWAEIRDKLIQCKEVARAIEAIEKSLFVLCLDDFDDSRRRFIEKLPKALKDMHRCAGLSTERKFL
ncbi:choline/carnitine O-acyltransferase [Acetomicrobium sp. UBA5826]|uniref:choline/carnitine O-acyltransferase n=1 Tax=Acetomicrobium sp. UBA5826 TaxID=1946039 RepID=UPI00257A7A40|nr:choline/carnitine O-acyltransferase [Acetomicrobium sp. UBA5826]